MRKYRSPEERFWANVEKTESCWLWNAATNGNGNGHFLVNGRKTYAYRFAWELLRGPIPDGMVIDHDNPDYGCGNPRCVNPDHLEPVTQKVNVQRGRTRSVRTDNKSGVRGVSRRPNGRWLARVTRYGVIHHGGDFATIEEAEQAVIALRNKLDERSDTSTDRKVSA